MKYILYVYILLVLLFSCRGEKKKSGKMKESVEIIQSSKKLELTKLNFLLSLPRDSIMDYFDLSNDSIRNFPDLSEYTIQTLNLSFNLLDTLVVNYLPQKIETLIISHNKLKGMVRILRVASCYLKEIDMSYNNIERISISDPLYRLIASHNALVYVALDHENIRYLDISFNPHLSNKVAFYPSLIDTIIRNNISNDEPLYNPSAPCGGRYID